MIYLGKCVKLRAFPWHLKTMRHYEVVEHIKLKVGLDKVFGLRDCIIRTTLSVHHILCVTWILMLVEICFVNLFD